MIEKSEGSAIDALIGSRVREQREALGMSIRDLATAMAGFMSETGKAMGPGRLLELEKGKYRWTMKTIAAAAQGLGYPADLAVVLQLPADEAALVFSYRSGGLGGVAAWLAERRGR